MFEVTPKLWMNGVMAVVEPLDFEMLLFKDRLVQVVLSGRARNVSLRPGRKAKGGQPFGLPLCLRVIPRVADFCGDGEVVADGFYKSAVDDRELSTVDALVQRL